LEHVSGCPLGFLDAQGRKKAFLRYPSPSRIRSAENAKKVTFIPPARPAGLQQFSCPWQSVGELHPKPIFTAKLAKNAKKTFNLNWHLPSRNAAPRP
jgi:hypothetical protein